MRRKPHHITFSSVFRCVIISCFSEDRSSWLTYLIQIAPHGAETIDHCLQALFSVQFPTVNVVYLNRATASSQHLVSSIILWPHFSV